MSRICLYYVGEPERDRWLPGDRYLRPLARRILRGKGHPSGIDKVFLNLASGLRRLGIPYEVNLPFRRLRDDDQVGVIGRGRRSLAGYDRPNPIVAGVAMMTHPSEWPTLCDEYPVARHLQHCDWANDVYKPYFGARCVVWPVGIDTDAWAPAPGVTKQIDFLVYEKFRWDHERYNRELLEPALASLRAAGLTYQILHYGAYRPEEYQRALQQSRAMLFFCSHESQGIAYQEALASGVPVLAWDPGECLDPNRFAWGDPRIPATSVPYFDERCGLRFELASDFSERLAEFQSRLQLGLFAPRDYVLENLTLERCAGLYADILADAQHGVAPPLATVPDRARRSRSGGAR